MCQIFDWYIASVSLYEIAKKLNNAGVPTKNRSRLGWTAQKISELVNSECYTGVAHYNKRRGLPISQKIKANGFLCQCWLLSIKRPGKLPKLNVKATSVLALVILRRFTLLSTF